MVKNTTGGNKTKKQKRNFGRFDPVEKIEIGQMFAQIIKNNGGFFDVLCSDGIKRRAKLCGDMKKGPRLKEGSFVVVTLRDFETDQKNCDIIYYGNPPNDIAGLFKKTDVKGKRDDIDFVDDNDAFKEFEESNQTIQLADRIMTNSKIKSGIKSNEKSNIQIIMEPDVPVKSEKISKSTEQTRKDSFDWSDI